MTQNLLIINDNKTNIMYLVSPHCLKPQKTPTLLLIAPSIIPNGSVKNQWVIFDKCINMYKHVSGYRISFIFKQKHAESL